MADEYREIKQLERLGGELCLDFVNTADWEGATPVQDCLTDYNALVNWGYHVSLLSEVQLEQLCRQANQRLPEAQTVFQRAIALRNTLQQIFGAIAYHQTPDERSLQQVNQELTHAAPHLRIAYRLQGYIWQWQTDPITLDSVLWPVVWSAVELLKAGDLGRVKKCPGEHCGWLFIDSSRNRSRRWCDMRECGNRAKASRHYQKHQHSKKG